MNLSAANRTPILRRRDFDIIVRLVYQHAGISLSDSKQNLVVARLARRLRALNLSSFSDYTDKLQHGEWARSEIRELI
ncbi:MAG: hypothetical protein JXX29_05460, partial [Deltaproteobacteria bacterium]|nr:hypothetical protein [Deltaproteobacteria bacterium]